MTERTAELQRERDGHKSTRYIANEQNLELGEQLRQAQEDADRARTDAKEVGEQLKEAQAWCVKFQEQLRAAKEKPREWQQATEQTRSAAKGESKAARREAQPKHQPRATARDTITPLGPPPEQTSGDYVRDDPFLALMMEYVLLRDDLTIQSISWEHEKPRLPDRTEATIEAHAFLLVNKKRHEFYNSSDRLTTFQSTWIAYGRRLDEASEAMLRAKVRLKIESIKKKLGRSL